MAVTLTDLIVKVRRLSRVITGDQMTDDQVKNYINMSILYDFPSSVKLFDLRREFTFYTQPNVDQYATNTVNTNSPLYNFKNAILQSSDPVYVGGYPTQFTQSMEEFRNLWPTIQDRQQISTGDGGTTVFEGTLQNIPVLNHNVQFTSINSTGLATALTASVVVDGSGNQTQDGNLYNINGPIVTNPTAVTPTNTINFVTGVYKVTFPTAPADEEPIYSNAVQYSPARPYLMLYFNDTFTLRPVPDGTYPVVIESQVRPTELIASNQVPELEQWFEYIAYLAAIKICQDRSDHETVAGLKPELERQETFVERRTLIQQGNKRAATIYVQSSNANRYWYPWYSQY